MERLLASGRCRCLITSRGEAKEFSSKSATLLPTEQLATVSYRPQESYEFRVELQRSSTRSEPEATREGIPHTAKELMQWFQSGGLDETVLTGDAATSKDVQQDIRKAMRLFPQGDSDFANSVERQSPLAAWIASPDEGRPARWKRIADVLPFGWIDLVNVGRMDTVELIQAMQRTDTGWKHQAVRQVVNDCNADSSLLVDLVPLLNVEATKAMAAHVLLLLSRTYRSELESILPKAATIWLDAPYDEEQILNVLFATSPGTSFDDELLQRFLRGALVHPRGSLLRVWAQVNNLLEQRAPISLDLMRSCMNVLPEQWWSTWALDWLDAQLSTAGGREWLAHHPKNWPALIFRPKGEQIGLPGHPRQHQGYVDHPSLKLNILMLPDGEGTAALMDVHDMVQRREHDGPVHVGRIHPLVGWLACDVGTWPDFSMEELLNGNPEVAKLLIGRAMLQRML